MRKSTKRESKRLPGERKTQEAKDVDKLDCRQTRGRCRWRDAEERAAKAHGLDPPNRAGSLHAPASGKAPHAPALAVVIWRAEAPIPLACMR